MSPPLLLRSSTETPHPSSPPSKPTRHFDPTALRNSFDRLLQSLTTHPFVQPLISIHSQYQSFIQVHLRVPRVSAHGNVLSSCNFAAILPGDSVAGLVVANGVNSFLNLYNTLLVVRLVLTWFPNSPPAIVSPLSTICDPYLNIFRGIIPPLGGTLDLSPILAFLVLNVLTSSATALPAELPPPQPQSQQCTTLHPLLENCTETQKKWIHRLTSKRRGNIIGRKF